MAEEAVDVTPTDVTPVETPTEAPEVAVETTTETPSSEVEQTTEATEVDESTEEVTDEAEVKETETEDVKVDETEELKPKSQNRFQRLANENRVLKQKLMEAEELKVPTEEEYLESGQDEVTASLNAIKAERQQEKAVEQIVYLNQSVDTDIEKVMHEYPALDPTSKVFNEKLAMSLMGQYDTDTGAQYIEQNGQKIMVSTTQLPYDYIKEKMNLIGMASDQAKIEAQKNVESMVAHADTPSSSAPQPADSSQETLEQMRERLATLKF